MEDGYDFPWHFLPSAHPIVILCQVMHDEAVTTYTAIVNQMTFGLDFLKRELNVRPRVGWHIGELVISEIYVWIHIYSSVSQTHLEPRYLLPHCMLCWDMMQ